MVCYRLGAWQFLADMPFGSISLTTSWNIFWNIYCKKTSCEEANPAGTTGTASEGGACPENLDTNMPFSPSNIADIQEALKGQSAGASVDFYHSLELDIYLLLLFQNGMNALYSLCVCV